MAAASGDDVPAGADTGPRRHGAGSLWPWWTARCALAVLPLILALAAYYPSQLAGAALPTPHGDAALYAYQLQRAAECRGQWWRVAADNQLGAPYPPELTKHPGLYEGVDLMLLATLTGVGALGASLTYHLAVLIALAGNGWVAAWIVLRITRSTLWSAVAATLITLNQSTAARILGHLHLFKFGWILLAVWAFVRFVDRPQIRRGLALGLAVALVLQSSFYLGFFAILGLGFAFLVALVAGRLERRHAPATAAAVLVFGCAATAFCFPVWTRSLPIVAGSRYFQRDWFETWNYSSELWQYLVPRTSWLAHAYYRDVRGRPVPPLLDEGWNFPGYAVLAAVAIAVVSRLRGKGVHQRLGSWARVSLGLMAVWTVLSLAGGPSALIYFVAPSFRCYGRSGLLVVALGAVVAPLVFHELIQSQARRRARVLLTCGVLALVATDAWMAARSFPGWPGAPAAPEWVQWLASQPQSVRLAAFAPREGRGSTIDWWGVQAAQWQRLHHHATLNGGDFALLEGDLRLLGGSYERINPAGLQLVVSLGYETLAFHRDYLAANSWLSSYRSLEPIGVRGAWQLFKARPTMPRLPVRDFNDVLALGQNAGPPREAPAGCWITGPWNAPTDLVVTGVDWALVAWTDDRGRPVSPLVPALFQHIFGPSIPAYVVRTPARPGSYRLTVFDRRRQPRARVAFHIVPKLAVGQPMFPATQPGASSHSVVVAPAVGSRTGSSIELTLANTSPLYIQAHVFREHVGGVAQIHPGLDSRWQKAHWGALVLRFTPAGVDFADKNASREIALPEDLPPGGRLRVTIPVDRLPPGWCDRPLRVEPSFSGIGSVEAPAAVADLRLTAVAVKPGAEVAGAQAGRDRVER